MNSNYRKIAHVLFILLFFLNSCKKNTKQPKSKNQSMTEMIESISQDVDISNVNVASTVDLFDDESKSNERATSENQYTSDKSVLSKKSKNYIYDPTESSDQFLENQTTKSKQVIYEKTALPSHIVEDQPSGLPKNRSYDQERGNVTIAQKQLQARTRSDNAKNRYNQVNRKGSQLRVIQEGVYINVGRDFPGISINRRKSEKITIAVFPKIKSQKVDIYLHAIPTYSHLVRNDNTLIGYIKNAEVINNQAQFTRYWNGQLVVGRFLRPGAYNIYVEYHCKNTKNQIISRVGRFWGGNHRKWTVKVYK